MSAEQCSFNHNKNKRASASGNGISDDSITSCGYNIADFQNCKVVLFNEKLPRGSHVNVVSHFEKKILSKNKCNRKTLHSLETENRPKTQSPKKRDGINLRITRSRNIDIIVPSSHDIESGTSSSKELLSTEQVTTIQNNSAKKICTRDLEQPVNKSLQFDTAISSVPGKTSDAICISPKTTNRRPTRNSRHVDVNVSLCDSEKDKKRVQPNAQNVNDVISEEVIVPANIQNPNSRLGESFVENSRVPVTSNNQFHSKYRVRKPNVQLSVVTSFLSYTVLDNNSPSASTEDLRLDSSTVPPSDCSVNSNSLLANQSIKNECEFDVDSENATISTPTNHENLTISTDVFAEPSLIVRNQSLPVRINSAEYVKRFPRKRSKVAADNSVSEDNTDSELSSLPDLANSVSSSARKVPKRNVLNSSSKLGTNSTHTQVKETGIDTSLPARDEAVSVLKETEQNSAPQSADTVQEQKIPRKRGRPLKKRRLPPSQQKTQNAPLPQPPPNSTLLLERNAGETTVSLSNREDNLYTTLLQKYTALLECNLSPRVQLKRLDTSRCLKSDLEPSAEHINANLTSEIIIKSDPESFDESDWPYNNNMSPVYIKLRPNEIVTVDSRDFAPADKVIFLDIGACESHSGTDSSVCTLDYVVQRIDIPERDLQDGRTACVSHRPSSSKELVAFSNQSPDSSTAVNERTKSQNQTTKPALPKEPKPPEDKWKSVDRQETSSSNDMNSLEETPITSSKKKCKQKSNHSHSKEETNSKLKAKTNLDTSEARVSEESQTVTDTIEENSLLVNVEHSREKSKTVKLKHSRNSVESDEPIEPAVPVKKKKRKNKKKEETCFLEQVSEKETEPKLKAKPNLDTSEATVPEESHTENVTDTIEQNSLSVNVEKSKTAKLKHSRNSVESDESIEPEVPVKKKKRKNKNKEKNCFLEQVSEKETEPKLKAKTNLDTSEARVSEESHTENVTDTIEENSLLVNVEHPEDTNVSHSRERSKTAKLKHSRNSVESDEPIEPEVPVKLMKKKRKNKNKEKNCFLEQISEKKTEPKLKSKTNLDTSEARVSEEYHTENVTDTIEENSLSVNVEHPEDTNVSHSRERSKTAKLKHSRNSVESDESIEPAVPVKLMKLIDQKKKKRKNKKKEETCFLEQVSEKKTKPKLKWKMKLGKHLLSKMSRKHVLEDTSDEEEISVFENIETKLPAESSTTEENENFHKKTTSEPEHYLKTKDVPNETDKEDMKHKDFDNKHVNYTEKKIKTKLHKKIKLDEDKQTTEQTESFVVKSVTKNKEQSSELENVKSKLTANPSTTQVTSKLEDSGKCHKKNYEQLAPPSSKELGKIRDVHKRTDKKDAIQKDFNKKNTTMKNVITKSKQNIKLAETKQTTGLTDYCGNKSISKLADKTQSAELENLEPKLSTVPVTIEREKLKRIPKISEKCRTNLVNKVEPAPPKEVDGNPKKMNELENSAVKNVKLSENLAVAGVIASQNTNSYAELRRRATQLPHTYDVSKLQEILESFLFPESAKKPALVNPLANASEPLKPKISSSSNNNKQNKSYLAALGLTKLPNRNVPSTTPKRQISFDINRATTTANEPFVGEGITKIISNTENAASKNEILPREAHFPRRFIVPSIPQRKRIRFNTNTNAEEQTLPSKNNTDNDSCKDGMEKEMRTTSEECSARSKHSFNFVDTIATPTKRTQKIKIKRPEMSDILTRTVKRKPPEDDSISIYADSICNDAISVRNDFDLDDEDKKISPVDTSDIVSDWIRGISGHATDNVIPQNTNSTQVEEKFHPMEKPQINSNMFVEDEKLSPTNTSVLDRTGMAESTTKRPCLSVTQNTRTFGTNNESSPGTRSNNLFDDMCKFVMEHGFCKKYRCPYQHTLPIDWEITMQKMSNESLRNLYSNTKKHMHLYMLKKIFPIVAKQLGLQIDFNSIISLVKDVLEININSDRTPYINAIIDALRSIGMTFNSVIEVIFNSTYVARNLKELLTDILINICVEQSDIENSWSTMQLLMNYRNYQVDAGIIKTILRKCMKKSQLQRELCLKVYSDLISHISDDKLGTIFESLLNDYIECLRTLGLSNEAQTLYERTAALPVQSSGSLLYMPTGSVHPKFVTEVSPVPIIPLFDIKFPVPPKLPPAPILTPNATHISPQHFNATYRRPIVNKVMPWNNKPDLLLKDVLTDKPSNVPSTSATVAPCVEEIQTYSMSTVKQAIITENLSQLMALILQYKEGDLTDEFLKTCLDAMQESAHNFAVLFRNLCQSVIVFRSEQDVKKDESLKFVFKTIGTNLIIYSTHINKWEQAYYIYQTLRNLYGESDITNVKMFLADKPSYIKRLLIICRIFVKKDDCRHAWKLFKVNGLHTSSSWTEVADQQDVQYRDLVFTELMAGLNKGKHWQTAFTIIEYILKHNITELDPIVDNTIQLAIKNDCHAKYITSFMSVCPVWYNRIHCHTFRVIVVKLVRDGMYKMAFTVYRQGCELEIYPHLFGNEKCLEFSTHYVLEEILLMLKVFLHNVVNFLPIKHTVVIKAQQSTEVTDESELPSLLYQNNMSCETMHVRIVNILNNYIKPPIRVVNKYSHLEITPAELEKHLEVRRTWN